MSRSQPRNPFVIGKSVEDRPIEVWPAGNWSDAPSPHRTLVIGGMHGDEPASIELVRGFVVKECAHAVALLPVANPDGAKRGTRYNARGIDPNRNFGFNWREDSIEPAGPEAWSEPESRALRDFIAAWRPAKIIALHWALGEIDADGVQSTALAEVMWAAMNEAERRPYRLRVTELGRGQRRLERIDAECPGSLGQWAGYGLVYLDDSQPSMITLELPFDPALPRPDSLGDEHLSVVQQRWQQDPRGYLDGVRPGVEKMLRAAIDFVPSVPL